MSGRRWASVLAAVAAVVAVAGVASAAGENRHVVASGGQAVALHWQPSWRAAPQPPVASGQSADGFSKQTIRMVTRPTVAGEAVRIHVSNAYGTQPLQVSAASVGVQASGPIVNATRSVTFAGSDAVSVPVGAEVVSDAVPLPVLPGQRVEVSLYVPGPTGAATWHNKAQATTYLAAGNYAAEPGGSPFQGITPSWFFLDGLDVLARPVRGTVVAFGDSITDGSYSTLDAGATYPDQLAARAPEYAVLNAGIGGNQLLTDTAGGGASGLHRFARDALDVSGVDTVLVLEGVNDIGAGASASQLISGLRQLIAAAHAHCVRILGATITPFGGSVYDVGDHEAVRQAVNQWIRTSGEFDGVVDFDAALRDPSDPTVIDPRYHTVGDLHPNDVGYRAMADAVDLSLLRGRVCNG